MKSLLKINTPRTTKEQYEKNVRCDSPTCDNIIPLVIATTHNNTCMSCILDKYNSDIKLHDRSDNNKEK